MERGVFVLCFKICICGVVWFEWWVCGFTNLIFRDQLLNYFSEFQFQDPIFRCQIVSSKSQNQKRTKIMISLITVGLMAHLKSDQNS